MSSATISTDTHNGSESPQLRRIRLRMGAALIGMGVLHFVIPKQFDRIIPSWLRIGTPRFWTLSSGVAELASGALMMSPTTARVGGAAAFGTIAAVYPANIHMAVEAGVPRTPMGWASWIRLPFQFPMLAYALRVARGR